MSNLNVGSVNTSTGMYLPQVTTANRPAGVAGLMVFNIESNTLQVYDGTDWVNMSSFRDQSFTNVVILDYTGADQSFLVPENVLVREMQVFMWGAGGGGDESATASAGAGGYSTGIISRFDGQPLSGDTFTIVVGQGGARGVGSTDVRTSYGGGGKGSRDGGGGHVSGGGGGLSGIFAGASSVFGGATPFSGAHERSVIIAGGGGGANDQTSGFAYGGGGGGLEGGRGGSEPAGNNKGGWGGRQSAGYSGTNASANEADGGPLRGGDGLTNGDNPGGGGGYYGGQSGGDDNSGAGGGSAFVGGTATYQITSALTIAGGYGSGTAYDPAETTNQYYLGNVGSGSRTASQGGNGRVVIVY